jgi:hypothetical protein
MEFFVMKQGAQTARKVIKMVNGLQWSSARYAVMIKKLEVNAVNNKENKSWLDVYISEDFGLGAQVGFCIFAAVFLALMVIYRYLD